jgi:signal transduction histidine kinase/sugar phosphate isomerase/epimerase
MAMLPMSDSLVGRVRMPFMRFGYQTIIWGRRIDDLEYVLDVISACRFEGVEFFQKPEDICIRDTSVKNGRRPVRDIDELLALLQSKGRNLTLLGIGGGTLHERIVFCRDQRPKYLCIEEWNEKEAEKALKRSDPFSLALHPHWLMPLSRTSQARQILEKNQPKDSKGLHLLQFVADTAHLTIVDDNPVEIVREFIDRLAAVHLKDWTPCVGRFSRRHVQGFVSLGRGLVKLADVLAELERLDYAGWVVVEQDCPETTPSRGVWTSAKWLAEKHKMPMHDNSRLEQLLRQEADGSATIRTETASKYQIVLLNSILPAAVRGTTDFYQAVVDSFRELGGMAAVMLYSYCRSSNQLYLVAINGLDGCSCMGILDGDKSLCGRIAHSPQVRSFDLADPKWAAQFSDQQMLHLLPDKRMITVPIFNPVNEHHLLYLLNLFPEDASSWKNKLDELAELGAHVGRVAGFMVDGVCSTVALQTSHACGKSRTVKEFLERLVDLVQRAFNCEGVSVFLVNRIGSRLEPAHSTGMEWDPQLRPHEQYYPKGVGLTGQTWDKGDIRFVTNAADASGHQHRSWETRRSPDRDECLFAPLARLAGNVVGVIRLVNKRIRTSDRASTMFTDDDAAVLDSIIQASLPHLELLQEQQLRIEVMARMTHEFQGPIVAIRGAVELMQKKISKNMWTAKQLFGQDYLNSVWDWTELLIAQVESSDMLRRWQQGIVPKVGRTLLLKDVIAPIVHQMRPLLIERGYSPERIKYGNFDDIPPLLIDRGQFRQVVFNLLSNAIKYAQDKITFHADIQGGKIGSNYVLWFTDHGIGINPELKDIIFEPGFRAPEATDKDVIGQGLGLSVVRTVVEAHGGRIELTGVNKPTKFTVYLPESLEHTPPKKAILYEKAHFDD